MKIKTTLRDTLPSSIVNVLSSVKNIFVHMYGKNHQKWLANYLYKSAMGKDINWNNPQEFNEKVKWMLFNSDTTLWTLCADKYRVREFIEKKGYSDILVKLYGAWDNADKIVFSKLPDQFVLKTNHGCGDAIFVKDKTKINESKIRKQLEHSLKQQYGLNTAEPHYLHIKPCIIAEELLGNDASFSSTIVDYKFYTFSGKPISCGIFYNRDDEKHKTESSFYDMNWNKHPEWQNPNKKTECKDIPRPQTLERMIKICNDLCKDFQFVRMDLYEYNGKVYFGEFTFTPSGANGGSLNPKLFEDYGKLIDLSKC